MGGHLRVSQVVVPVNLHHTESTLPKMIAYSVFLLQDIGGAVGRLIGVAIVMLAVYFLIRFARRFFRK